jgi:hypothetical protein
VKKALKTEHRKRERVDHHEEDGHGVGLELRVVLQGRVAGVAQEGEHLLCTQRDLKDPVFFRSCETNKKYSRDEEGNANTNKQCIQ